MIAAVVMVAPFQRCSVPNEPDDYEYEKQSENVAEHDYDEPNAIVLRVHVE